MQVESSRVESSRVESSLVIQGNGVIHFDLEMASVLV